MTGSVVLADATQMKTFIHQVPTEVMTNIFIDASRNSSLTDEDGPAPLIISSVCRSWRDIALETPVLWSSIEFHTGGLVWVHEHFLSTLKRYLKRSRQHPLFIAGSPPDKKVLDALIRHSERWRELHLFLHPSLLPRFNKVKGRVPLLEVLSLDTMCHHPRDYWHGSFIDGFESAPALTNLTLSFELWRDIHVPWDQITDFTSNRVTLKDGLGYAGRCHNLSTLTLGGCDPSDEIISPMTLRSVHSLQLVASMRLGSNIDLSGIFLNVTFPGLTSLAIDNYEVETGLSWPHENFLRAMARNLEPSLLTTFSIRNVLIDHTQLVECLELFTALETLSIVDFIRQPELQFECFYNPLAAGFFAGAVLALTWHAGTPRLVPKLTTLSLRGRFNVGDEFLLEDMITSRCRLPPNQDLSKVAKLNYVCLEFGRRCMKDSTRERLRRIEEKDRLEIRVIENSWAMSV